MYYEVDEAETVAELKFAHDERAPQQPADMDTSLFARGYITVGVLDGNWGVSPETQPELRHRLRNLVMP